MTLATSDAAAGDAALDATHVYWSTWDGLFRMPLAGGDVVKLFDGPARAVTLDPTGVSFYDELRYRILRVGK